MKADGCCVDLARSPRPGWVARSLLGAIGFYQRAISPALGPRCRYFPTCSDYAVTAIARFGVWRGLGFAGWRLLRCHPFCRGGADPVPEGRPDFPGVPPAAPRANQSAVPAWGGKQG